MVSFFVLVNYKQSATSSQRPFICSQATIETREQCVKYVQSSQERQQNNEVYWCLNC